VAFANSAPTGYPAVLFINVRSDGRVEEVNLDELQRTFSDQISAAFPPIYTMPRAVASPTGTVLAVIVPGSSAAPHFAGKSYVRTGSQTLEASEPQFEELLAKRSSKAHEILKWKGRQVSVRKMRPEREVTRLGPSQSESIATVIECNQFWVTLQEPQSVNSVPLERVRLSFDHPASRLRLEIGLT